jgi:hypothetical protein
MAGKSDVRGARPKRLAHRPTSTGRAGVGFKRGEFDNMDGYTNSTLPPPANDQAHYNISPANAARAGMSRREERC